MAAASFGHLPAIFAPAGPMPSGLGNREKARVRELFALGKVGREALLAAEAAAYHAPGTCTFYGTANTNQMMLEVMGLQLPGAAFVNPGTPLRDALTEEAVATLCRCVREGPCAAEVLNEAAFVNAMVGGAGEWRVDESYFAFAGDGAGVRGVAGVGGFCRAVDGGAAVVPVVSEW